MNLRQTTCAVALVLTPVVSFAQPRGGGPGPVLGIVEIPKLFSLNPQTGEREPQALTLYAKPDSAGRVAVTVSSPDAIDDAEYGYEEAGALVYGRRGAYYLIRTARGAAWLAPDDAGGFHSMQALLTGGLTYLTDAWNGFVSAGPGATRRTRVPRPDHGRADVKVNGFRTVGGRLWLNVEVLSRSVCESDQVSVSGRGWVPAHDQAGAPTVWFASRGC